MTNWIDEHEDEAEQYDAKEAAQEAIELWLVKKAAERRVLLKLKEWLRKPGSGDYTRRDLANALSLVEEFSTLTREDEEAA